MRRLGWLVAVPAWQKTLAALAAVVALAFAVDAYFAKQVGLDALAADVRLERLENRQDALERERVRLESVPQVEGRPLTRYEAERLDTVRRELEKTKARLRGIKQ